MEAEHPPQVAETHSGSPRMSQWEPGQEWFLLCPRHLLFPTPRTWLAFSMSNGGPRLSPQNLIIKRVSLGPEPGGSPEAQQCTWAVGSSSSPQGLGNKGLLSATSAPGGVILTAFAL